MLKRTLYKLLAGLFLFIYPTAYASIEGWYLTGKLGTRGLFSEKHQSSVIGLTSLGFNVGYQFDKFLSAEVGFFTGESVVASATESTNINYGVSHIVTGIKSVFYSHTTFDFYSKIGLGWALFSKEDSSKFVSVVTQIGCKYSITPEVPVGISLSLISTKPSNMFLVSADISYYFGK